MHVDESGADAQAGLNWTFVHAGERKVDGNSHAPLSGRAKSDLQADVDQIYDRFVSLAAANRRLTPTIIRATEAAVYRGQSGVTAGLADRIGTIDQVLSDLSGALDQKHGSIQRLPRGQASSSLTRSSGMNDPNGTTTEVATTAEAGAAPGPEPVASDVASQLRSEFAEIASIAAQAARLGIKVDAADSLAKGVRPEALRRAVLDELAARSAATDVVAAQPKPAGDSPIVRRARERAAATRC